HERGKVGVVAREVDLCGVDDEHGCVRVVVEELGVCAVQPFQVVELDVALVGNAATTDTRLQNSNRRLQVDDQVGRRHIDVECFVDLPVQRVFVLVQR